jgi:tetratricopeptide (TPR) repeat protein
LAIAYSQSGRHESAIEIWKKVVNLKSDSVEAYTSLTVDYEKLGRFQECLDAAEKIVRIDPDSAIAHGNVAVCNPVIRDGR